MNHPGALSVEGTLRLEAPRSAMELRAAGPGLHLELQRTRGLLDLLALRRSLPMGRARRALSSGGLDVSLGLAGLCIARLDAGCRGRIHPLLFARALVRRALARISPAQR